jgi:hypothetical protein
VKIRLHVAAIIALVFFLLSNATQAADDLLFRTNVTPEDPWVGQQTLLKIDVLAKDGWAQLKKVGDLEIDGAYVMRLESQGTRLSEDIDGDSYTGQRYEFMIFAQRDGKLTLPATPVDVEVTRWGADGGKNLQRMSLPIVEFTARIPPGGEGLRGLVSTHSLTASQDWDPATEDVKVGDAIRRIVTLRAADVSGMAFAPLHHAAIEGVGIYPGEPTVEDKFNRGDLSGTRTETVTYVFEQTGDVEIPALVFSWWNVRNSELQQVELPGQSLQVAAGASSESATAEDAVAGREPRSAWFVLGAIVIAAVISVFFGGSLMRRLEAWREARKESEAAYFKQVMLASRAGDQAAVLRCTMRWLDRINTSSDPARLDQFLLKYGDEQSRQAASEVSGTFGSKTDTPHAAQLASGLKRARTRWLRAQKQRKLAEAVLPALNGSP